MRTVVLVETYLKYPGDGFVVASESDIPLPDPDYIEGAIRLIVDGKEIIGLDEWDYVDQLWCYIADMIVRMANEGYAETYFPDQPVELSFRTAGPRVLVACKASRKVKRASAPRAEFVDAIRTAGLSFFETMSKLTPSNAYAEAEEQLSG